METKALPIVNIDDDVKIDLLSQVCKEAVITVHCSYFAFHGDRIRIWESTYLKDNSSGKRSRLVFALNIPYFPVWKPVRRNTMTRFTLFFSSLPKSCKVFDLYEDIPEPGGFKVWDIKRNKNDVYHVKLL